MIKKNDPLVGAVQKIMAENAVRYQVEQKLCEELGIYSKNALPNEHKANFDALLDQRINEALHPNQQKLDVHEPEKDKLTAQDFKMLRSKKTVKEEEEVVNEAEKLDELKGIKNKPFRKLGYFGAAAKVIRKTDPMDMANDPDTERKFTNRLKGLANLVKRTQKEEVEEGGETREGGAVTKDGKAVVSPTAMKAAPEAKGPSASDRSALTDKIKSIMKEAKEKIEMDEAAKSKSQQRLFGAALATRRGESEPGSRKIAKLAADVPESELKN